MYKILIDEETNKLISPFHNFISDVLVFLDLDTEIKYNSSEEDIKILLDELETHNEKLYKVAKVSNLKKHIYYLKSSSFSRNISLHEQYQCYLINYQSILDGDYLKCYIFDKPIKDAFDYFYENIGGMKTYLENYVDVTDIDNSLNTFRKNLTIDKTCAYCDLYEVEYDLTSVDHFLPKSSYPILSIFPSNLVVACTACNDRIKRNIIKFPICHPYFHNASEIIEFGVNSGFKEINIQYKSNSSLENSRAKNFIELFEITRRYNGKIEYLKKEREEIRIRVKTIIQTILNFRTIDEINFKEIIQNEYDKYLIQQTTSEGTFQMSKVKADLVRMVLENQLDFEVEYIQEEIVNMYN